VKSIVYVVCSEYFFDYVLSRFIRSSPSFYLNNHVTYISQSCPSFYLNNHVTYISQSWNKISHIGSI